MDSRHSTNQSLLFIAILALLAGLMIYMAGRDIEHIVLSGLLPLISFEKLLLPASITNNAPSLIHCYAFILLSRACLQAATASTIHIVVFWCLIECLFEVGQHPFFHAYLMNYSPGLFVNYFLNGTHDILDIVASLLGGLLALFTIKHYKYVSTYKADNNSLNL